MDKKKIKEIVSEAGKELGYPSMKAEQLDVVVAFLEGRDVFAILPPRALEKVFVMLVCQQPWIALARESVAIQSYWL